MTQSERYSNIIAWFEANMPVAQSELHYDTPFQLLIAVVLSAQCTDKRVNLTTPRLFADFPTPEAMAAASVKAIFDDIKSISYPNSKATYLSGIAKKLVSDFGGRVPDTVEQLQTLPGVGRKTANVVTSIIFGQPRMAVDTHVFRIAERLGLTTNSKNPLQTERELVKHIPTHLIPKAHHWLILHGRYVCVARKPKCTACGLRPYCRHYEKNM